MSLTSGGLGLGPIVEVLHSLARQPPLPGQEEGNATYLMQTGAAVAGDPAVSGDQAAELLFGAPDRLSRMREAAGAAGTPRADDEIARDNDDRGPALPVRAEFDLVG